MQTLRLGFRPRFLRDVYKRQPPGYVVDYVGGVEDIRARVLRCIGEPDRRFEEDSLRLMREMCIRDRRAPAPETDV